MKMQFAQKENPQYKGIPIFEGMPQASVEDVRFDSRKLKELEEHFLGLIKKERLQAAAWLLSREGKVFSCASMGRKLYNSDEPMDPHFIRRIASVTKLFTTVAILQLYEQGKLNIYYSVSEVLEEFNTDTHRGITIAHLLTHTSGLPADSGYFLEAYPAPWLRPSDSWIKYLLEGPLQSKPGECWSYSSRGFWVLGEIVRRVSGLSYEEYITRHIIKPLKMKDTSFKVPKSKMPRLSMVSEMEAQWMKNRRPKDPALAPPPSGGGIYSTLFDMYRFGQCLLQDGELEGARILSRKSIELMGRNQLSHIPAFSWGNQFSDYPYGMGAVIEKDEFFSPSTFGHEGAGACALMIDKENQLVYIYFVPFDGEWVQEAVDNPRAIIYSGIL